MKREGLVLLDVLISLALIGLLALCVNNAIVMSTKSLTIVQEKSLIVDQCQRIVESLKVPSQENNDYFKSLTHDSGFTEYECDLLPEDMSAFIRLEEDTGMLQTYTVTVRRGDIDVEFIATRLLQ